VAKNPPREREPVNDARSMGEELKRTGFDVQVRENLTKEAMQRAIDSFYGKIRQGMTGLLFFSGYGSQTNPETFLIPDDAETGGWRWPSVSRTVADFDRRRNAGAVTRMLRDPLWRKGRPRICWGAARIIETPG
jgi:hypothetical protein